MTNPNPTPPKSISDCPPLDVLREYLVGNTDESIGGFVDQHLETCPVCNESIQALEFEIGPTLRISDLNSSASDRSGPAISEEQIINDAIMASKVANQGGEATKTIGPYRLLSSIGRGGMGEVYRAEHIKLKKIVAIKLLPIYVANALAIERFEREIQAAGKLNHPSIVNSTDAGVDSGYQYLAMEFIEGVDLGKLSRRIPNISSADVCEMGRQIALGLAHAHHMGMVHRDIKPSNVMLDNTGSVKLLDFGLVLLSEWDSPVAELTTVGQFLGTLDYMAPEQAERSGAVDHRSDLYSLGVTLFRLLTGQLPLALLPNQSPLEKLRVLTNHSPVHIQTLRKDLPDDLASFIDRLLSTDPKNRPESAARVAETLEPFCKGADLVQLATRAAEASAQDDAIPEPRIDPKLISVDSVRRRTGVPWWTIVIAACLPLVAYFGIRMILEDSQGNLVIQSEVEQVRVRLIHPDGKSSKDWQVQQGNSITKLQAGKYEISIDSPSDSVSIDKSTMTIKKGETVIARVTRQEPSPASASTQETAIAIANQPASSTSNSNFPTEPLPDFFLNSTYKGKTLEETFRAIGQELNYATWLQSVEILEDIMPDKLKPQVAPFVVQSATEKRFTSISSIIRLRHWLTDEEIDDLLLVELSKESESRSIEKLLHHIAEYHAIPTLPSLRKIDWTHTVKTWDFVEKWLAKARSAQQGEIRNANLKIPNSFMLTDWLFERYPNSAFTICQYYETGGMGGSVLTPIEPSDRSDIRVRNRIRLAQTSIDQNDKESFFYQILLVDRNNENVSVEREYWKLVSNQISQYLKDWARADKPVLQEGVTLRLGLLFGKMHFSVFPSDVKRQLMFGMGGGMGGGMAGMAGGMGGGFGGAGGMPSLIGSSAKASLSIELLDAYLQLPEEFRPKEALEEVRKMLAKHLGDSMERTDELFPMPWSRLQWNDQFHLEYEEQSNKKLLFPADQMPAAEAYVLHRWVGALLDSDMADPSTICDIFVREMIKPTSKDDHTKGRKWIVARGRESWPQEGVPFRLTTEFQAYEIEYWARKATVTGRIDTGSGNAAGGLPAIFQLELEKEGWRIRNLTVIMGSDRIAVVDF